MAEPVARPLITPTIHSNGSGADALVEQRCNAATAARALQQALQDGAPHGRDFYPQGPDAYTAARDIYVARMRMVTELIEDLTKEAMAIQAIKRDRAR